MTKKQLDASHLIDEFKKGNPRIFTHIFDLHYRSLCYFAQKLVAEEGEAEDIVSQVMFKLWSKHADFDSLQSIKAFLYISTRNACLDYLKKIKRQDTSRQAYINDLNEETWEYHELVIETELLQALYTEIEDLPDKCRKIFKMSYFEGLNSNDIAEKLNISVKTVRNQRARAVVALKSAMVNKKIPPSVFLIWIAICHTTIDFKYWS
jgi:RNA polymerase sigma-70 factor (family 1)